MRLLVCAFGMMFCSCDHSDVHKVCVNHLEPDSACGTGFFIESEVMMAAYHVIAASEDNVVTVIGPGVNITSSDWDCDEDADVCEVYFDEKITEHVMPLCRDIPDVGAEVDYIGFSRSKRRKTESTTFTREVFSPSTQIMFLEFDSAFRPGFSGGPIISVKDCCVFGMILGAWGYDETKGRGVFLGSYRGGQK